MYDRYKHVYVLVWYTEYMDKLTITKEELIENLKKFFSGEFIKSLDELNLDEEERQANIVLSRKKIQTDAENLANLVFNASDIG